MDRNRLRHELACAIWTAWVAWAKHDPSLPRHLRTSWSELPVAAKDPAYRMADAALAVLDDATQD